MKKCCKLYESVGKVIRKDLREERTTAAVVVPKNHRNAKLPSKVALKGVGQQMENGRTIVIRKKAEKVKKELAFERKNKLL